MKNVKAVMRKNIFHFFVLTVPLCVVSSVSALEIRTTAFATGQSIPSKYSYKGENISPELVWSDVPANTVSFVIIVDDPDAPNGDWVHWVIYNIPGDSRRLTEGFPKSAYVNNSIAQGFNDFGLIGYDGPYPPQGRAHRYYFKIYALSKSLNLKAGLKKKDIVDAIKDSILQQAEMIGMYGEK